MSKSVILRGTLLAGVLALLGAPAALADATASTSSNWSGYVAHGDGARFTEVSALWTQPSATCTPGSPTYSAVWVGIGGYSLTSQALEQIGTETDCSASGHVVSSAWYELVPSPSTNIGMIVRPGDVMGGKVTVVGHLVTLTLTDHTRHKSFTRKVMDPILDITSADWIVEAPSECSGAGGNCQALPLANYGSETFARATAETVKKQTSSITSRHWQTTAITLSPSGRQFVGFSNSGQGESSPSPLLGSGSSFKVTYVPPTQQTPPPQQTTPSVPSAARITAGARVRSAPRIQPGGVRH